MIQGTARPQEGHEGRVRIDIQLLRALAILLVLAHHARIPGIPGGFLGVDIFYVISGYLMTGLIVRDIDRRNFTFGGFYARRIRRLLPAAFATLAVTALAAPLLLDIAEYRDFVKQLVGSFGFFANIALWQQSNYFASGAQLKPLLHMWSLSFEEQYYLLIPLVLFLIPRALRTPLVLLATGASLALCLYFLTRNPAIAFYMLPTRAWEMGLGSLVALRVAKGSGTGSSWPAARAVCLLLLLGVPLLVDESGHPGLPAIMVCATTALLMMPGLALSPRRWLAPFVAIGDRSYSLYLVHWPVYAFANNVFIRPVPLGVNLALLGIVLLWTELQYRLVEQRFRRMRVNGRSLAALALIAAITIGGTMLAVRGSDDDPAVLARRPNSGLADACASNGSTELPEACRTAPGATTQLWGDSLAMALAPGLAASLPGGLVQTTMPVCGPFIGIAPVNDRVQTTAWAQRCIAFNDAALDRARRSSEIDTVVLSSILTQYAPGVEPYDLLVRRDGKLVRTTQNASEVLAAARRTVAALHAAGKRVVFAAPTPDPGFDMARCRARDMRALPTVYPAGGCAFTLDDDRRARAPVLALLRAMARTDIPVASIAPLLCPEGGCPPDRDGIILYRDHAHLSIAGSQWLGRHYRLGQSMRAAAR